MLVATDRALEPTLRRHLGVDASRVRVVPNAVDLQTCARLAGPEDGRRVRARAGLRPEQPVLLSVGRIEQNKGFHTLVPALRALAAPGREGTPWEQDWRWVMIGDGPHAPRLMRQLAQAGLRSRVMRLGWLDDADLHAWYEAATLFVHPSLYEGSSLVTLEAMAHRRPVVATAAGGIPDKVNPGVSGWLVPPGASTPCDWPWSTPSATAIGCGGWATRDGRSWNASSLGRPPRPRLLQVYDEILGARRGED